MKIKVRKAQNKDAVKIAKMLISIGELHHTGRPDIYRDNLQKYDENDILEFLKDENSPIFVATDENDEVAGYAFCQIKTVNQTDALVGRKYVYIDDFCTDEKYRRQNVGSTLMDYVKTEIKKMGIESIELNVWEFNDSAIKFYEKCGFVTLRREMEIKI